MTATASTARDEGNGLTRLGLAFARWSQKWFPDPLVFAFIAVLLVFLLTISTGERPIDVAVQGGRSFWTLIPFTMQMAMVLIGGYVVASAPVMQRCVARIALVPRDARRAIAFIALFSMLTSLLSWGLSLIFSGQLVRAIARRMPDLDYRAAGAAGYLGLGVTWALGLSSSAAMMMATESALPKSLVAITGVIPLRDTLFSWQNGVMVAVMIVSATLVAWASAPRGDQATNAAAMGVPLDDPAPALPVPTQPGEKLEHSPVLSALVAIMLLVFIAHEFATSPKGVLAALDLNTYNLIFIAVGLLLHWRPASFLRAVNASVPATGGVLIQFPFYAMIFGMIVETGMSDRISKLFIAASSPASYPLIVAAYSSTLGLFIPSGGSKWLIEAPYVLDAAIANHVSSGWIVQIYNAAEALPNLVNPFFMLPLVAILRCRARDLVGYGMLQLVILLPIAYLMCWLLAFTF